MVESFSIQKLALLTPVVAPPRLESLVVFTRDEWNEETLSSIRDNFSSTVMSLDIETKGNDPTDPDSVIVGLGLSDKRGSVYLEVRSTEDVRLIGSYLQGIPLIGHNLFFDASYLYRDLGYHLNWKHCTFALYKYLATEGYPGQRWGLKEAEADLLGWTETNEVALGEWLVNNGLKKQNGNPDWAQMWQAPSSILGHYCALDCDATYQLFMEVLLPGMRKTAGGRHHEEDYYGPTFIIFLQKLIEQRFSGITINLPKLLDYNNHLLQEISRTEQEFKQHPAVRGHLDAYRDSLIRQHQAKEPEKWKKLKVPQEPPRLKKNGEVSKNWLNWNERKEAGEFEPVISKNWENWKRQLDTLVESDPFNIHSGPQKQWLFYEALGYQPTLFTDSGQPAVDERALKGFGEPGKLLITNNEFAKEQGYVQAVINSAPKGILHPSMKVPGTLTGRLAGAGGVNVQQMPKSPGFLACWEARPGKVWVDCDHTSLEQVVLAELSRDPSLLKLYGPNAKPNDVYLFTGANLPVIGKAIREAGYDPDNPTPEGISAAKKKAKEQRQIAKVVTLASSYGAGAAKIQQTLRLSGVDITEREAKIIHQGYWELYGGVKKYEAELLRQWNNNNGWIYNGIGRPIGISEDLTKDIINRQGQSTGHDLHVYYINEVIYLLAEAGISWAGIIIDLHDAMVIEVDEAHGNLCLELMGVTAYERLNKRIGGAIKLKGDAKLVYNLAESKCE